MDKKIEKVMWCIVVAAALACVIALYIKDWRIGALATMLLGGGSVAGWYYFVKSVLKIPLWLSQEEVVGKDDEGNDIKMKHVCALGLIEFCNVPNKFAWAVRKTLGEEKERKVKALNQGWQWIFLPKLRWETVKLVDKREVNYDFPEMMVSTKTNPVNIDAQVAVWVSDAEIFAQNIRNTVKDTVGQLLSVALNYATADYSDTNLVRMGSDDDDEDDPNATADAKKQNRNKRKAAEQKSVSDKKRQRLLMELAKNATDIINGKAAEKFKNKTADAQTSNGQKSAQFDYSDFHGLNQFGLEARVRIQKTYPLEGILDAMALKEEASLDAKAAVEKGKAIAEIMKAAGITENDSPLAKAAIPVISLLMGNLGSGRRGSGMPGEMNLFKFVQGGSEKAAKPDKGKDQ